MVAEGRQVAVLMGTGEEVLTFFIPLSVGSTETRRSGYAGGASKQRKEQTPFWTIETRVGVRET
jgi:hypothetical protein